MKEICLAAVVCIGMMGVGWAEEENTVSSSAINIPSTMKMIDCTESYADYYVDAATARNNVPPGYTVKIYPNGKAVLCVLNQYCNKCVLDGFVDVGPMNMSHVWIELDGPEEYPPAIPGTTGSIPTRYWYIQPHLLDNIVANIAFSFAGIDTNWAPYIDLGGAPGGIRSGNVVESCVPYISYAWSENVPLWQTSQLVTGRQRFYRNYGAFGEKASEGMVTCRAEFLGIGPITLEADRGSMIWNLGFGETLLGTTNAVNIDCDVEMYVHIFK
jgi:hypothetical protein